jgi:hypothetical protein
MIYLFIIFLTLICSGIGFALQYKYNKVGNSSDNPSGFAFAGLFVSFCVFIMLVVGFSVDHSDHLEDLESLNVIQEEITIYQTRADEIKAQVAEILVEKYQLHEKEIFKAIAKNNAAVYLVKYPELNTHKTFSQYANILIELDNQIYATQLTEVKLKKSIAVRKRKITTIPALLPQ